MCPCLLFSASALLDSRLQRCLSLVSQRHLFYTYTLKKRSSDAETHQYATIQLPDEAPRYPKPALRSTIAILDPISLIVYYRLYSSISTISPVSCPQKFSPRQRRFLIQLDLTLVISLGYPVLHPLHSFEVSRAPLFEYAPRSPFSSSQEPQHKSPERPI